MWPLVRSKYGVKRPLAPAWVTWLFPVAVFVVAWLYLLVRTRHDD